MPQPTSPATIAILGPGLLGGSLALALKRQAETQVRLWARRAEALAEAEGAADLLTMDLEEAVRGAEMVVLATPVTKMVELAQQIAPHLQTDCLVTDVGSVKASLVQPMSAALSSGSACFIGSHPMAGSEKSGFKAARADLFERATTIITPQPSHDASQVARLESFWSALGCKVLRMDAEEHDRKVARISHLPHAVAAAVVRAALSADASAAACSGNGFRDATRIADGEAGLWTGILLENRAEVLSALKDVLGEITELVEILQSMDEGALHRYLEAARSLRQHLTADR
jgi:prephenate dehydrogenase